MSITTASFSGFTQINRPDERRVAVRGLPFLAGSESHHVPESIPMANEMVIELGLTRDITSPQEAAAHCRPLIQEHIAHCGGLLFRQLPFTARADFNDFMAALDFAPCSYAGGIAVRQREAGHALMASNEDPRITMAPHNEMAYLPGYPEKIFFFCARAAEKGGEVPINDIRLTRNLIPDEVLQKFQDKGIRYYRHLPQESDPKQIGWKETFAVSDREALEVQLGKLGYDYQWLEDGGIAYSYAHSAFIEDPQGGAPLWFNQVTELHSSYWRSHPHFAADLPETAYPATTAYGDGEPIPPELITFLRAAMWQTTRAVKMAPGDLLALDNRYIQHGRFGFEGPRMHLVSITH